MPAPPPSARPPPPPPPRKHRAPPPPPRDQLDADSGDWDFASFLSRDLDSYLKDSAAFMAEAFGGGGGRGGGGGGAA